MALTVKLLKDGALSGTAVTYSPGTGKGAVIKSIVLTNKVGSVGTATVKLASRDVCPPGINIPGNGTLVLDFELTLSNSDTLSITGTGTVDCLVSGIERDN